MADPKSGADCLKHCRDVLDDYEYRLACSLIELYAMTKVVAAIEEVRAIYNRAFTTPITAAEATQAEGEPQ